MMHDIGVKLQAKLVERGCPIRVVDGPERTTPATYAAERIVIEETSDTFGPPKITQRNPPRRFEAHEGAKITIYAQSPSGGAMLFEHKDRAKQIRNMVLVALDDVLRGDLKCTWSLSSGAFVPADDLKASELPAGARYELTFAVDRGVFAQTWAQDKEPDAAVTGIAETTNVFIGATTESV